MGWQVLSKSGNKLPTNETKDGYMVNNYIDSMMLQATIINKMSGANLDSCKVNRHMMMEWT